MIGKLTGEIVLRKPNFFIVNVHGVGYSVHVPLSTYFNISEDERSVSLEIYTHVKEDSISLYGFLTEEEKELFESLISISGIGPKLAINLMSGIDFNELVGSIRIGDVERLRAIPGVGKKTAERVILELKDKLKMFHRAGAEEETALKLNILEPATRELIGDAVSALTNLGFKSTAAKTMVEHSLKTLQDERDTPSATFEDIFRRSLKLLMKR